MLPSGNVEWTFHMPLEGGDCRMLKIPVQMKKSAERDLLSCRPTAWSLFVREIQRTAKELGHEHRRSL